MATGTTAALRTLNELVFLCRERGKAEVQRYKQDGAWHSISGEQFYRRVARLALTLQELGVRPGDRVALLSENRPEWSMADLAIMSSGAITVPLYTTLTPATCRYILAESECRVVFVSNSDFAEKISGCWPDLPRLEHLLTFGGPVTRRVDGQIVASSGLGSLTFDRDELTAEQAGRFEAAAAAARPGELATIVYTSGTTGTPKGVMLSHDNIVSNILATPTELVDSSDLALSFLPLSHIYERMVDFVYLHRGVPIAYAESIETVPQNLLEVRPTVVAAVPRFFEKMYARVRESVGQAPAPRRKLFWWAMGVGTEVFRRRLTGRPVPALLAIQHRLADRLVFHKLRARLGGRIKCFISGSAPLSAELAEFFNSAGVTVCEGYGLTETSPVVACTLPSRVRPGAVGPPIEGVEVRIAADGEILVRGPNVMHGYYQQTGETARVLRDGWFYTGDIGEITPEGDLRITDRKKDLLKTAGGKFVAPQPIENRLRASAYIANAVVFGDRRRFVTALLAPDLAAIEAWARQHGFTWDSPPEWIAHPDVRALLQREVDAVNAELAQFEQVKRFALLEKDFSIEAGELTPTMKVRRRHVEEQHRDLIESLYAE